MESETTNVTQPDETQPDETQPDETQPVDVGQPSESHRVESEASSEETSKDSLRIPLQDSITLPNGILIDDSLTDVTVYVYKNRLKGSIHRVEIESVNPNALVEKLIAEAKIPEDLLAPEDLLYSEHPIRSQWVMPSARQFDRLREESSVYMRTAEAFVLNPWRLKQRLIRYCLRSVEVPGIDLALEHDDRGRLRLTETSEDKLGQLHPSLMDALYSKFTIMSCLGD